MAFKVAIKLTLILMLRIIRQFILMVQNSGNSKSRAEDVLYEELHWFCQSDSLSKQGLLDILEHHDAFDLNISEYKFFLGACCNEFVTEEIIQCLLEYFPLASRYCLHGLSPLHIACNNKYTTPGIIKLLIDAHPDSVRLVTGNGDTPLHILCDNKSADETKLMEILALFLEKYPESVRNTNINGFLPIHLASAVRSPQFCAKLIESYPGSERISTNDGAFPLHCSCMQNDVSTVEYVYNLYPDAINERAGGEFPITFAILGAIDRSNPVDAADVVQFLLDCDPNVKLQKAEERSLLQVACSDDYNDTNIDAGMKMIEVIYDSHPAAIEDGVEDDIQDYHNHVRYFLNDKLVHAQQARDLRQMMTADEGGQLPLHYALRNNIRLGSIKLMVNGFPDALRHADNKGAIPLHIACQCHVSTGVIKYLISLDIATLNVVDSDGNTPFHHACLGARYETISLLLDEYGAASISTMNANNKLPIDVLLESKALEDRESVEYTNIIFRLLSVHPETLVNANFQSQQSVSAICSGQLGKKRRFGKVD